MFLHLAHTQTGQGALGMFHTFPAPGVDLGVIQPKCLTAQNKQGTKRIKRTNAQLVRKGDAVDAVLLVVPSVCHRLKAVMLEDNEKEAAEMRHIAACCSKVGHTFISN